MNSITLQSVRGSFSAVSTLISASKSWNAIDEIYKIYIFLHRSDHKNSAKCVQMLHLYDFFKKSFLSVSVAFFVFNFDEVLSEFYEYSQKIPQNR